MTAASNQPAWTRNACDRRLELLPNCLAAAPRCSLGPIASLKSRASARQPFSRGAQVREFHPRFTMRRTRIFALLHCHLKDPRIACFVPICDRRSRIAGRHSQWCQSGCDVGHRQPRARSNIPDSDLSMPRGVVECPARLARDLPLSRKFIVETSGLRVTGRSFYRSSGIPESGGITP